MFFRDPRRSAALPAVVGLAMVLAAGAGVLLVKHEVESRRETASGPRTPYTAEYPFGEPAYVGSEKCSTCHRREYEKWLKSNHTRSVTLPSPLTVKADLDLDSRYVFHDVTYSMAERDGRYFLRVEKAGLPAEEHSVDYVTGSRRIQMFLTRFPDGRVQSLPLFREVDDPGHPDRFKRERGGRWFDYSEMVWVKSRQVLGPEDPGYWKYQGRNWNERCTDCHISRTRRGFDPGKNRYETGWLELTIGCEACHGPGSDHVRRWTDMEGIPKGRDFPDLKSLSTRKSVEACAECHSEKDEIWGTGFLPGGEYADFFLPRLIEDDIRVYPDGRYKELNYEYFLLSQSLCHDRGGLSCIYCHDPHGSDFPADLKYPRRDDRFCTDCHADLKDDVPAHTFHSERSEGSRCLACHAMWMPIENRHGVVLDHTFSVPSPRNTIVHGIPNACNSCHADKTPEWSLGWMREWYGDRRYRIEETADVFAKARTGDSACVRDLARLVENPGEEVLVYRASAAKLLGRFPCPEAKEALMKGVGDGETMLRVCCIFGLMGQSKVGVVQAMRRAAESDASLAVRKAAACYLVNKGDRQSMQRCRAELMGLVQTTPNVTNILTWIGHTHYVEEDFGQASATYRKVLEIFPFDRGAFDMLANIAARKAAALYADKKYAEAVSAIGELDGAILVSPLAELWRGYAHLGAGDSAAAAKAFGRGAAEAPDDLDLRLGLASALYASADFEGTVEACGAALGLAPSSRPALLLRALSYEALRMPEEAAADAREILKIDPEDAQAKAIIARSGGSGG